MPSKSLPLSTLPRAEMLLAIGLSGPALELFDRLAPVRQENCAYRSLQIRLLKAAGRWEEGMAFVKRVRPDAPGRLRQAAARFLVGYALWELARGNGMLGANLIADARTVWP